MKNAVLFMTLIIIASPSLTGQGIFKKIENAAKGKLSKKTQEAETEEKKSDVYPGDTNRDSNNDKIDSAKSQYPTGNMNDYLSQLTADVKYEDTYKFDARIDIEMTEYGSRETNLLSILTSDKGFYGMQHSNKGQTSLMIIDENNNSMISYDESRNRAMALPYDQRRLDASLKSNPSGQAYVADARLSNIKKLDKPKNILGHTSHGYRYEDEEFQSDMYFSRTFPVKWTTAFGGSFEKYANNVYKNDRNIDLSENMIMYGETTRKKDGEKTTWEVVKLEENPPEIRTTEMNIQSIFSAQKDK